MSLDYTHFFQSHDVEFIWSYVEGAIKKAMDVIPLIKIEPKKHPRWYTPSIKHFVLQNKKLPHSVQDI